MRVSVCALGLGLFACSGPAPAPGGDVFVALPSTFDGFHAWPSVRAVPPPGVDAGLHGAGEWTAYIERRPPAMSASFPIGTIIVKESSDPDPRKRTVFAMVKRGGGYNAQGAVGWEWFELTNGPNDEPQLKWRGTGPPSGEMYGGDPNGCNGCHAGAKQNDWVWTAALSL